MEWDRNQYIITWVLLLYARGGKFQFYFVTLQIVFPYNKTVCLIHAAEVAEPQGTPHLSRKYAPGIKSYEKPENGF